MSRQLPRQLPGSEGDLRPPHRAVWDRRGQPRGGPEAGPSRRLSAGGPAGGANHPVDADDAMSGT
eukprot:15475978-Alexandrium_andersonii.AAC.1